ncbi:hypothetical protein ASG87_06710 [Frateuria sp. Soil773]|uniref:hypothetical protein n=1 Tax=Frateuria sp. Soil773 TaxID=1736407 RepID=UPI0006F873BB|nr:hypothetical protein [Frateuria sp. Soil773]KRE88302.1 hypothetical protein ASG87_06710 [Frateuria sp. Soil773]
MGHVAVAIKDAMVFYSHYSKIGQVNQYGNVSNNHDLNALVISNAQSFQVYATNAVQLSSDNFIRFKNGGKRLPSSAMVPKGVGKKAKSRDRLDRTKDLVREGDVGPYSTGHGSLKPNVASATLERDHLSSDGALKYRANVLNTGPFSGMGYSDGQIKARGIAMAIEHDIHVTGYSHGSKQKKTDTPNGMTRLQYVAQFPSEGLYLEIDEELAAYNGAGLLTYELVGSYRYLYRMSVKNNHVAATDDLDSLIEAYLRVAA